MPGGKWWDFRNQNDVFWLFPKAIKFNKGFLEIGLGVRISNNPDKDDLNEYLLLWFKQNYNRVWETVEPYSSIISRKGYDGYYIQEDGVLNLGVFKSSSVSIISSEGEPAPINYFGG
jgi:hypothetical protein